MDAWWDPSTALLWNMEGSHEEVAPARSFHLTPNSAWYAAALLLRAGPGDEERAIRTIDAVIATQYDEPDTEWHGTYARTLESPRPRPGARIWIDYDPNWRQFVGTTFELLLQPGQPGDALPEDVRRRMAASIELAVQGEPLDRVPPTYSNIALMRAWLEVERGRYGAEAYAHEVREAYLEHGALQEYNSPTYYGIDLYALALWRDHSSSDRLREWGAQLEDALWRDVARWYHPGLRNLCGPWSRSYGMDMTRYLGMVGLWILDAVDEAAGAPVPDVSQPFDHSHDFTMAPLVGHLRARVPSDILPTLRTFRGEHTVEQVISTAPARVATGWLADDVMAGGEAGEMTTSARGQFTPATVHWRLPDDAGGAVGWIRLTHFAPASATASPRHLAITCRPHPRRGPQAPELWVHAPGARIEPGRRTWSLPGLDVEVAAAPEAVQDAGGGVLHVRFPTGTEDLTLRF
jgi:hypothetical protein